LVGGLQPFVYKKKLGEEPNLYSQSLLLQVGKEDYGNWNALWKMTKGGLGFKGLYKYIVETLIVLSFLDFVNWRVSQ